MKARFDGIYTAALNAGRLEGIAMDCCCYLGTIITVLRHDGVVEGGTGKMEEHEEIRKSGGN